MNPYCGDECVWKMCNVMLAFLYKSLVIIKFITIIFNTSYLKFVQFCEMFCKSVVQYILS